MLSHLKAQIGLSPLGRLMDLYGSLEADGRRSLAGILEAYEEFAYLVRDGDQRSAVERAGNAETDRDRAIQDQIESIGQRIQDGLEKLFFDDPLFVDMTTKYGLF